ncbi:MAG: transposase [Pseudomonadota bacterium]
MLLKKRNAVILIYTHSFERYAIDLYRLVPISDVAKLKHLQRIAIDEILAYYDFNKISSGPMEGTNNKIKTLQDIKAR